MDMLMYFLMRKYQSSKISIAKVLMMSVLMMPLKNEDLNLGPYDVKTTYGPATTTRSPNGKENDCKRQLKKLLNRFPADYYKYKNCLNFTSVTK